jgi:hypothetical protein
MKLEGRRKLGLDPLYPSSGPEVHQGAAKIITPIVQ